MPYHKPQDNSEVQVSITSLQTQITNNNTHITNLQAARKRVEVYDGTTNASGDYSVVFSAPFATIPHINPVIMPPGNSITRVRVTSVSREGFTVKTEMNGGLVVLGLSVLGLATTNVASVPVSVLVREK